MTGKEALRRARLAIALLSIFASIPVGAQSPGETVSAGAASAAIPEWLAPFPQARDQSVTVTPTGGASAYVALATPEDVIAHYEKQIRNASVDFREANNGMGVSIEASTNLPASDSGEKISAVIRVREDDLGTKVNVSYAVTRNQPSVTAPVTAAPDSQPLQAAPIAAAPDPNAARDGHHRLGPPPRGTYTWVIQSVRTGMGSRIKYSSFYYESATNRSVEHPLTLPYGASVVGVFPDDCEFSVQDELGHSFTFGNEKEAEAHGLGPGTWSVFPRKCSGIDVFLR